MATSSTIRLRAAHISGIILIVHLVFVGAASANIFGKDDREPVVSREYPWRCLGLVVMELESGEGGTGTGFLIGPNLVLTNAHCTLDESGKLAKQIHFCANLVDGVPTNVIHVNHVWRGTDTPSEDHENDWAVLRLDSNLGDDLGWLKISTNLPTKALMVGYSGDYMEQKTAAMTNCSIYEALPGFVFHDGDATRGSSGGPLVSIENGKPVVVALNACEKRYESDESLTVDEYDEEFANCAISASTFAESVKKIVDDENSLGLAAAAQRARNQIGSRDYDAAVVTLSELIGECPKNCWALLLRGYVKQLQNRGSAATGDYQLALDVDPDCISLLLERALYCYTAENYQECITVTSRILMISAQHKLALQLRGIAYHKLGQDSLAGQDIRLAETL